MVSVAFATRRERIIPLNKEEEYINARGMASQRGTRLPSNVLHDEYLTTDRWRALGSLYPAWSSDILVYPEKGGRFRIGKDIIDQNSNWVYPASYIPREAIEREKVGLILVPDAITKENGRIIVHAKARPCSVKVLYPFIQENGKSGKIEPSTGVPIDMEPSGPEDTRYLCRNNLSGVAPIARYIFGAKVSPYHVVAKSMPQEYLGVSGVSYY